MKGVCGFHATCLNGHQVGCGRPGENEREHLRRRTSRSPDSLIPEWGDFGVFIQLGLSPGFFGFFIVELFLPFFSIFGKIVRIIFIKKWFILVQIGTAFCEMSTELPERIGRIFGGGLGGASE